MGKTFNQSRSDNKPKTDPVPACRERQIQHRPKDRIVMIRREFVEICGGNPIAAALLNECEFVAENRFSEGEDPWFQRKASYWVTALQGLASERTIREAFKVIKALRLVSFREANGDQAGAWYRLNIDRLQAAIDGLDPDRTEDPAGKHPGRNDTAPQSGMPTTPAGTTGHPGKNVQGSHLLYTRAPEPLLEPSQNQQQADSEVTDCAGDRSVPLAAARGGSFRKTLQAIKARGFPFTRPGEKWEHEANASGFTDGRLADAIGGCEFDVVGVRNPVVMIRRAVDALTAERGGSFGPTIDAVRVAETQALNGLDEGRERLQRYAKCGDGEIEKAAQAALKRLNCAGLQ